jgi:hypothetical protein
MRSLQEDFALSCKTSVRTFWPVSAWEGGQELRATSTMNPLLIIVLEEVVESKRCT